MNDFLNTVTDFVKGSPLWALLCAAGFVICLLASVLLMPAAELLPAQVNVPAAVAPLSPGLSPVRSDDIMKLYADIASSFAPVRGYSPDLKQVANTPFEDNAPGELRAYVLYAIGFSLALIAAAIAVCAIGRFEAEEKTVIPVKK